MSTQTLSRPIASAKTNTAVRITVGLALSFASGIMLTAAFVPYNAWPLIFVAFIPLIIAQYRVMPAKLSSLVPMIIIHFSCNVSLSLIGPRGMGLGPTFPLTAMMATLCLLAVMIVLVAGSLRAGSDYPISK